MKKLDWNEYHNLIDQLADQIKEVNSEVMPYRHLFGVDTDSLIVASHLSNKLEIPLVTDISLLVYLYNIGTNEEDTLLVSNVIKTGKTFRDILGQCNSKIDTAVLIKDAQCSFIPTYFVDIPSNYIVFPWQHNK